MNYALIKDQTVVNIVAWDGSDNLFSNYQVVEIDSGVSVGPGWNYDGEIFSPPPKTPEEIVIAAEAEKQSLIDQANDYMNSKQWAGKAVLSRLTDSEKVQYNAWLDYLDALEAVDTSCAPDINWPTPPAVA